MFTEGEKVKFIGKVYDFGYYSQSEGKCILYNEGERNMQDSFVADVGQVSHSNEKKSNIAEHRDFDGEKKRRMKDALSIIDRFYQYQWFMALPTEERLTKIATVLDSAMTINSMVDYLQELQEKNV